jgi:hypothetical protein
MNIQSIYLGLSANDSTGDTLRQGGFKINDNFVELFTFGPGRHRQSLLLYKTLSGSPSFLESTGLAIDLIAPLVATIGAGFEQRGERNRSFVLTSDALSAWELPDNDISYIYVEQNSLSGTPTYGYSEFEPVRGQAAPPSPSADQHWFDTLNNQMYSYNGSTFDAVNRIFFAEVTTLGGIVVDINYYTSNDEYEYTDMMATSALSAGKAYTDLQTAATLVSANTYADSSAKKYALVFG